MKKITALMMLILCTGCGIEQVDEGYRGIETNWGKVVGEPLAPGLYFYNPVSSAIFEMDVREVKTEGKASCFTKDTQMVAIQYAVTYFPEQNQIGYIYSQFGKDWAEKVVNPVIQSSLKDVIGQYVADNLVQNRAQAQQDAQNLLAKALLPRKVNLTRLDLTNLDFRDEYENAVEAKVVAIQRAAEAKNKTVQVQEQAKQTVLSAKADAEAMKIKTEALAQGKSLVEYEAIQKWDGKLPEIMMGNSVPIINLEKLKR